MYTRHNVVCKINLRINSTSEFRNFGVCNNDNFGFVNVLFHYNHMELMIITRNVCRVETWLHLK